MQLDLHRRATIAHSAGGIPASIEEHVAIVDAVAVRDERRAGQLLSGHALRSRQRLRAALGPSAAAPHPPATAAPPPGRS